MKQEEIDVLFAVRRVLFGILRNNKKIVGRDYLMDAIKELNIILEGKKDSLLLMPGDKSSGNVRAKEEK